MFREPSERLVTLFLFLSCFGNHNRAISYLSSSSFLLFREPFPGDWLPFFLFLSCFGNLPGGWLPFFLFLFLSSFGNLSGRLVTFSSSFFIFVSEPFRRFGYLSSSFSFEFREPSGRLVTFLSSSFMFREVLSGRLGYLSSSFFRVFREPFPADLVFFLLFPMFHSVIIPNSFGYLSTSSLFLHVSFHQIFGFGYLNFLFLSVFSVIIPGRSF